MKKNLQTNRWLLTAFLSLLLMAWMPVTAQNPFKQLMRKTDPAYFKTDEARQVGDMARPLTSDEQAQLLIDKEKPDDSTTDNDATNIQMMFLARLYQNTKDLRYREAFRKGVEYLLSGQYENGGWPQFWPEMHGYQIHITYNDDAMVNTLKLFRDMMAQKEPYQGDLTDQALRKRMAEAFDKGIDCILATQIVKDGVPTVWCQQHDRETFEPAPARAFELPSYCSMESVSLTRLLMELPNPDDRVKKAVHAAMRWFDKYKLTGYKIVRVGSRGSYDQDTRLEKDPHAEPIWARFYDLENLSSATVMVCLVVICIRSVPSVVMAIVGIIPLQRVSIHFMRSGQRNMILPIRWLSVSIRRVPMRTVPSIGSVSLSSTPQISMLW